MCSDGSLYQKTLLVSGHVGATLTIKQLLFNLPFQSIITTGNHSGDNNKVKYTAASNYCSLTYNYESPCHHTCISMKTQGGNMM